MEVFIFVLFFCSWLSIFIAKSFSFWSQRKQKNEKEFLLNQNTVSLQNPEPKNQTDSPSQLQTLVRMFAVSPYQKHSVSKREVRSQVDNQHTGICSIVGDFRERRVRLGDSYNNR
jgi:hypothetical protein